MLLLQATEQLSSRCLMPRWAASGRRSLVKRPTLAEHAGTSMKISVLATSADSQLLTYPHDPFHSFRLIRLVLQHFIICLKVGMPLAKFGPLVTRCEGDVLKKPEGIIIFAIRKALMNAKQVVYDGLFLRLFVLQFSISASAMEEPPP